MVDTNSYNGLKLIIIYCKLSGHAYFGHNFNGKSCFSIRLLQISLNVLFIAFMSYQYYYDIHYVIKNIESFGIDPKKSKLIYILCFLGILGYSTQTLITCVFLWLNGSKILDLFKSPEYLKIGNRIEYRIGLFICIFTCFIALVTELTFNLVYYYLHLINTKFNLYTFIISPIIYFIEYNTQLLVISLIAYKCCLISQQIKLITQMISHFPLISIYKCIVKISILIKRFDKIVSHYILIVFIINGFRCISSLCILFIGPQTSLSFSVGSLVESLIMFISLSLVCNVIPYSYNNFLYELQLFYTKNINPIHDNSTLLLIKDMKNELYLTAFGLYNIDLKTLISCLSLILTYSVILIQTNV